jgi:serine phosphatase RsbU (regulator of sigma subunit)
MIHSAQQNLHGTAENIVKTIFATADGFVGSAAQHDDMTVLVMKCSATA